MKDKLASTLWLAYVPIHLILSLVLHRSNVELGYPTWVIVGSVAAQAVLTIGILLYVLLRRWQAVTPYWRWIFPLLVLEALAGIARDAVVPEDYNLFTHGVAWLLNLLFTLSLFAPAYYSSFRLAGFRLQR